MGHDHDQGQPLPPRHQLGRQHSHLLHQGDSEDSRVEGAGGEELFKDDSGFG